MQTPATHKAFEVPEETTCPVCLGTVAKPLACYYCRKVYCAACVRQILCGVCVNCKGSQWLTPQFEGELIAISMVNNKDHGDESEEGRLLELERRIATSADRSFVASPSSGFGNKDSDNMAAAAAPPSWLNLMSRHDTAIPTWQPLRALQMTEAMKALNQAGDNNDNGNCNPDAWLALGDAMKRGESHTINFARVDKVKCFANALCLLEGGADAARLSPIRRREYGQEVVTSMKTGVDPLNPSWGKFRDKMFHCWKSLARSLLRNELVDVRGYRFSKRDCLVQALQLDDLDGETWLSFAQTLDDDRETIALHNVGFRLVPLRVNKLDCLLRSLRLNDTLADAYGELALLVAPHNETIAVNGIQLNRLQLAKSALRLKLPCYQAWRAVAEMLQAGDVLCLDPSTFLNMSDDFIKALLRPGHNSDAGVFSMEDCFHYAEVFEEMETGELDPFVLFQR